MKRGYSRTLYNQRNKDETIMSVIKRLFGEHLTSRLVRTQNRELSFRCISYNMHRLTNLMIIVMVSTKPRQLYSLDHCFCCLHRLYIGEIIQIFLITFELNTLRDLQSNPMKSKIKWVTPTTLVKPQSFHFHFVFYFHEIICCSILVIWGAKQLLIKKQ